MAFGDLTNAPPCPHRGKLSCAGVVCSATHPPSETIYRTCKRRVPPFGGQPRGLLHLSDMWPEGGKSQNRSFRFSNFTSFQLLVRIVDRKSPIIEFAKDSSSPCICPDRVPSETPHLRRAYSAGDLAAFSPHPEKALISVRTIEGESCLSFKIPRRKNLPGGCILRRPCFCGMAGPRAQQLPPSHIFRALIRCREAPGAPLFSAFNRRNSNRPIKAITAHLDVPDARRFSSHGFRRGATNGLKDTGPPWSVVATSGVWNSSHFRGYVDMSRDVEIGAHRISDVALDTTSGNEGFPLAIHWVRILGNPFAGRKGRLPRGFLGFRADSAQLLGESWWLGR